MRKLLLASIAVLGVTGVAQAQTAPAKNVFDTGDSILGPVTPSPSLSVAPTLAPGQMAVRLNGALRFYYTFAGQGTIGNSTGKVGSTHSYTYIRLYPGFDAVAANGLRYGVAAELREDVNVKSLDSPGNQGVNGTGVGRNLTYWRRAYGYIAGDAWGTLRVGMGDGPYSLMATGAMYELGDANFCGDTWGISAINGAAPYPFRSCAGNMYVTNKIVYLSPQFAGFDLGFAYEPGTNTGGDVNGCTSSSSVSGCDSQSTGFGNDLKRRRNLIDVALRYRATVNGVGIAASGGYVHSGKINEPGGFSPRDGISVGWGGLSVSYAGFSLQGAIEGGREDRMALLLNDAPDQFTWQVGTSYTAGPMQVGVSYFESSRAGAWNGDNITAKRKDRGVYSAINYGIAPGLSAMLVYAWGDSKQPGADINSYKGGTQNHVQQQMVTGGLAFRW